MTGYDIELYVEIQACSTSHSCKLHQKSCIEPKVHLLTLLYFEKFLTVYSSICTVCFRCSRWIGWIFLQKMIVVKCGQNKIVVYEVVDQLHVPVDDGFTCAQNQVAGLFWKEMSRRRGINLLVVHNHEILLYIYSYRKLEKIPFMLFPIEFSLLGNGMTPIF